jgi:hypothetical protein
MIDTATSIRRWSPSKNRNGEAKKVARLTVKEIDKRWRERGLALSVNITRLWACGVTERRSISA